MKYRLVDEPRDTAVIAKGSAVRERTQLREQYGGRNWRKLKGIGRVELLNGHVHLAELHWYEAHGVGRRMMKVKRLLD